MLPSLTRVRNRLDADFGASQMRSTEGIQRRDPSGDEEDVGQGEELIRWGRTARVLRRPAGGGTGGPDACNLAYPVRAAARRAAQGEALEK